MSGHADALGGAKGVEAVDEGDAHLDLGSLSVWVSCGDALAGSLEPVALNLLDLKAFGERIAARDPERQTAEIQIRVALMNRFSALGTAEIVRVA